MCFVLQDFYMQGVLIHITNGPPLSTMDACSVELTQPLQKLWEKVMDKYMVKDKHKDSYMTAARLRQGRLFFLVDLGPAPGACRQRLVTCG